MIMLLCNTHIFDINILVESMVIHNIAHQPFFNLYIAFRPDVSNLILRLKYGYTAVHIRIKRGGNNITEIKIP